MKFDFVIGNPPYQGEPVGENKTFTPPLYHLYLDASYKLSAVVEMIHPARFLFNAGATPKVWNQKMLHDNRLKIVYYDGNSDNVFHWTDIKGGVAVTYHDISKDYPEIGLFCQYNELNSICKKVDVTYGRSLSTIIHTQYRFDLDEMYKEFPSLRTVIGSNGREKRLITNVFDTVSCFYHIDIPCSIKVIGLQKNKRVYRYIDEKYIDKSHPTFHFWKVLVPKSSGNGMIGEIGEPKICPPLIAYTSSFIGIGCFDTESHALYAMKYIKSKFCRSLLGVLKVTQDNNRDTWRMVPIQDFTEHSDIDWSKSIHEIDRQLYQKYGLDEKEIQFIENHVKDME